MARMNGLGAFSGLSRVISLILLGMLLLPQVSLAQEKTAMVEVREYRSSGRLSSFQYGHQWSAAANGAVLRSTEVWGFLPSRGHSVRVGVGATLWSVEAAAPQGHKATLFGATGIEEWLSPVILLGFAAGPENPLGTKYALTLGVRGHFLRYLYCNGFGEGERYRIPTSVDVFAQLDLAPWSSKSDHLVIPVSVEAGYRHHGSDLWDVFETGGGIWNETGFYLGLRLDLGVFGMKATERMKKIRLPSPDLHLECRTAGSEIGVISPGQAKGILFTITNAGEGHAEGVIVRADLEPGLTGIELEPLRYTVGDMRPAEARALRFEVRNHSHDGRSSARLTFRALEKDGFRSNQISLDLLFGPETPEFPARLAVTQTTLVEPNGNGVLDAGEAGALMLEVTNSGAGQGKIKVRVKEFDASSGLRFEPDADRGIVEVGGSKTISVPLQADSEVQSRLNELTVEIIEEHHGQTVVVPVTVETRALAKPEFRVVLRDYSDSRDLSSRNDPDGAIAAGEIVRVAANVQNCGDGPADDVRVAVRILGVSEGVQFRSDLAGGRDDKFDLGDLGRGENRDVQFYFFTNPDYRRDEVAFSLDVSDISGGVVASEILTFKIGQSVPTETPWAAADLYDVRRPAGSASGQAVDVDTPPAGAVGKMANGLGIVFGVESYLHTSDAKYKRRDAEVFYRYCSEVLGIPEERMLLRVNEQATKAEFDYVFEPMGTRRSGWIKNRLGDPGEAEKADIIVYIGGHGFPDPATGQPYFIPHDVRPEHAANGVSLRELYQALAGYNARSVLVFVEACFCGSSGYGPGGREEPLLANANPVLVEQDMELGRNVVVLSATSRIRPSNNRDDLRHGIFTYYVLKGLSRAADRDPLDDSSDGAITLEELYRYVRQEVRRRAYEPPLDREQVPEITPRLDDLEASMRNRVLVQY